MRKLSERHTTGMLFAAFLAAGAIAMMAAYLILGRLIVAAGDGIAGPASVIAAGALAGTLTAFVIHEVGRVLPGVMQRAGRTARE